MRNLQEDPRYRRRRVIQRYGKRQADRRIQTCNRDGHPLGWASRKVSYADEATARLAAGEMKAIDGGRAVRAYRCPGCEDWHLASSVPVVTP